MDIKHVLAWLVVVDRDMAGIRNNLFGPEPVPAVAAYHCQQAAEKLVKLVLVSLGQSPPKIHNIVALVDDVPLNHPLRPRLVPLEQFTPFGFAYRYPGSTPFDDPVDELGVDEVASWLAEIQAVRAEVVAFLELAP